MPKITRELDIGGGYKLKIGIDDGIAVMTSNYGKEMQKIYFQAKQAGKNVEYDYRTNTMIEKFEGTAEDFAKKIDIDYKMALFKQQGIIKSTKEKQK